MFRYRLVDQRVPAMCLNLVAARLEGRVAVGEGTDHAGASADLAHDAFEWIIGPDAAPMLLGESVVGQGLGHGRLAESAALPSLMSRSRATTSPG